ncbi:hypothetical protein ACFVFJ_46220 [Streptomyces sp. NPDC057717]|uniref:hypothetical protein n=1 Tax=Streptomyces sp. NPDC057717 TaxID=3346224 RepID=UPI0036CA9D83
MGVGLTPEPEKAVGFFLAALLDIRHAGSDERPTYRRPRHDLDGLADRLSRFDRNNNFNERFRRMRNAASQRLATADIPSDDT